MNIRKLDESYLSYMKDPHRKFLVILSQYPLKSGDSWNCDIVQFLDLKEFYEEIPENHWASLMNYCYHRCSSNYCKKKYEYTDEEILDLFDFVAEIPQMDPEGA